MECSRSSRSSRSSASASPGPLAATGDDAGGAWALRHAAGAVTRSGRAVTGLAERHGAAAPASTPLTPVTRGPPARAHDRTQAHHRGVHPRRRDEVLAINAANQPEVGPMDEEKLRLLAAESDAFPVVRLDGEAVGFAVLLTEGTAYQSPNYRWFERRNPRFYYVDRIAFTLAARGRGLGGELYRRAMARAAERPPRVAPRSTPSPQPCLMGFHERFDSARSEAAAHGPDEEVAMLEASILRFLMGRGRSRGRSVTRWSRGSEDLLASTALPLVPSDGTLRADRNAG